MEHFIKERAVESLWSCFFKFGLSKGARLAVMELLEETERKILCLTFAYLCMYVLLRLSHVCLNRF